ncbi:hypothetical protein QJ856_gp1123 [Tupanvirus deep ocean]|uniref:Uncharacterized protein n=2 Tax=Tupanvirus TaxID=2094720 RepID=A0AC62A767_9VIRU|nr:hypothetical protein QJ856_gp1123 [Tupanvirus deep ocean]QKU33635.1 hypothetical protein [Tupanvirus deep ocean]
MSNNYQRYLKYKNKYIDLKNELRKQRGGTNGSNFPLNDEIHFWGRQMMEHVLLLFLGLQDNDADANKEMNRKQNTSQTDVTTKGQLKNQAFELFQKWKQFMASTFYDKGVNVTMETIFLSEDNLSKVGDIPLDRVNELIQNTIDFKSLVINTLEQGRWIGWIYPALAKHMLQEAIYFKRKVNGPAFTPLEEIQFCNIHHSTEMGATAQMIDPDPAQQAIIDVVRSYALKRMSTLRATGSLSGLESAQAFPKDWSAEEEAILQGLRPSEETNMLMLSIRFSEELTQFADETGQKIERNELKSIISPALAHHIHREFARFTETLRQLQGGQTTLTTNTTTNKNVEAKDIQAKNKTTSKNANTAINNTKAASNLPASTSVITRNNTITGLNALNTTTVTNRAPTASQTLRATNPSQTLSNTARSNVTASNSTRYESANSRGSSFVL